MRPYVALNLICLLMIGCLTPAPAQERIVILHKTRVIKVEPKEPEITDLDEDDEAEYSDYPNVQLD